MTAPGRVPFGAPFVEFRGVRVEPTGMPVGAAGALQDVTQRFNDSVQRVVSSARDLSEPSPGGGDLAGAMVDMSVDERSVQATFAAVRTSNEMTSSILDIVA